MFLVGYVFGFSEGLFYFVIGVILSCIVVFWLFCIVVCCLLRVRFVSKVVWLDVFVVVKFFLMIIVICLMFFGNNFVINLIVGVSYVFVWLFIIGFMIGYIF